MNKFLQTRVFIRNAGAKVHIIFTEKCVFKGQSLIILMLPLIGVNKITFIKISQFRCFSFNFNLCLLSILEFCFDIWSLSLWEKTVFLGKVYNVKSNFCIWFSVLYFEIKPVHVASCIWIYSNEQIVRIFIGKDCNIKITRFE